MSLRSEVVASGCTLAPSGAAPGPGKGVSVLNVVIIDDSLQIQRSLGRLLGTVPGVRVVGFAEDARGALDLIDAVAPDVVVLDVNLRHGDTGMSVLRQVQRRWPLIRVVVLSNMNLSRVRQDYLMAGAGEVFDKSTEFMQARDWIRAQALALPQGRMQATRRD